MSETKNRKEASKKLETIGEWVERQMDWRRRRLPAQLSMEERNIKGDFIEWKHTARRYG